VRNSYVRKVNTKDRSLVLVLSGLVLLLCGGCAADEAMQAAAYERNNQRTTTALLAAGDADSLAAAALLGRWPKADPTERLILISRAVAAAPDRPDLIWLNIGACIQVESCDPTPLATQLRGADPANGAAEWVSISRAGKTNDAPAVRKYLAAIATSTRFDTYWNATIVHATNAVLRTKTMDLRTAFTATIGAEAAVAIPPYQSIVNACKGESLNNPDVVATCREVASVMRRGDTYIAEMVGLAIAKRAWPEGSAEYLEATGARRVAHYRMDMVGKIGLHHIWNSHYTATRLQLMTENKTEQEVNMAEIINARVSPNPPAGWTDKWVGS
jgi:hypothetical protein